MSGTFLGATPISPDVQEALHPGYRSGAHYCVYVHQAANTATAVAADLIYFYPIQVCRRVQIDGLAVRVGTAVGATNVKLALFDNAAGPAGARAMLAQSAAAGDMNETAGSTIALDFTAPYWANPGWYWGAALFNGVAQPITHASAVAMSGLANIMGAPNLGTYGAAGAASASRFTTAQAYSAGFPTVAAAPTLSQSNVIPVISWYPV